MAVRKFTVPVTTIGDGSATAYSPYLSGFLESIQYVKTDYADGVDFTITADVTGESLWVDTNVNAAEVVRPRAATHTNAGAAALYAAGGTAVQDKFALSRDRVKIVIAQGGATKTGAFVLTFSD